MKRLIVATLAISAASTGLSQQVLIIGPTSSSESSLTSVLNTRYFVNRGPDAITSYTIPAGTQVVIDLKSSRADSEEVKLLAFIQGGGLYLTRFLHNETLAAAAPGPSWTSYSNLILQPATAIPALNAGLPAQFAIPTYAYPTIPAPTADSLVLYRSTTNRNFAVSRTTSAGKYVFCPIGDNGFDLDLAQLEMRQMLYNIIDWGCTPRRLGIVLSDPITGALRLQYVANGAYSGYANLSTSAGLGKTINLIQDLNHDGRGDLVTRTNSTGEIVEYFFNGVRLRGTNSPFVQLNNNHVLLGETDIDRDGFEDTIFLDKTTDTVMAYKFRGTIYTGGVSLFNSRAGFDPIILADFDRDGQMDILWRDKTTGALSWWKLANGLYNGAGAQDIVATPPSYDTVTAADFDNNGRADIAFYNKTTKIITVWLLNATGTGVAATKVHPALTGGYEMTRAAGYWQ